jgi:hypothetical protein
MTIHRLLLLGFLIACGGGRPEPREPYGADPPPAGDVRATPCGGMIAHLDAEGFTDGGTVRVGDETVTRDSLALRCSRYSPWVIRCLTLALTTEALTTCGPGDEPTSRTYGGPTADEKADFEACVAHAIAWGQLDACRY